MNAEDFDQWRAAYPRLTFTEQIQWHSRLWQDHPGQTHYDLGYVKAFLHRVPSPREVLELGGWRGELARDCRGMYERWDNYELCREASADPVFGAPEYHAPLMYEYLWDRKDVHAFNVVIASHVIEHLSVDHLHAFLKKIVSECPGLLHMYIDSPLNGTDWKGETCFHVLPLSWDRVGEIVDVYGFKEDWRGQTEHGHGRSYHR